MNLEVADGILQCEKYEKKLMALIEEDSFTLPYSIQEDFLKLCQNLIQEEKILLKEILYNIRSIQNIDSV